jgi:ABC-2 type transport system permease protein
MTKFLRIFWNEYTRHVLRKRFLFAVFSVPFFIIVVTAISLLAVITSLDNTPIGYVDHSGLLAHPKKEAVSTSSLIKPVKLIPYLNENEARVALDAKKIQAYYVLAPDYQATSHSQLFYLKEPDSSVQGQFEGFLRSNLLASEPTSIAKRLSQSTTFIIQSADGKQEMDTSEWFNIVLPMIAGVLFISIIFSSGGYLMQAVVEEKENRTMEIIITSVSPGQLMAGKIAGDIGVGLTQLAAWIVFGGATLLLGGQFVPWLSQIRLNTNFSLLLLILFPSFVMIAALMAAVGATVTEAREAQQVIGFISLPIWIPYWLIYPIMINPNGALAIGLSFFPLTAPVTLSLRMAFAVIPAWQLSLNVIVLVLFAAGSLWLAGRTFRLGMLHYGKRLAWREIFSRA